VKDSFDDSRRGVLKMWPAVAVLAVVPLGLAQSREGKEQEIEVTPAEDLMREHGLLKRILLIYGEAGARIAAGQQFPPQAITALGVYMAMKGFAVVS
jgi:hypothetical protein